MAVCGAIPSRRGCAGGGRIFGLVLSGSVYPTDFPRHFRLMYLPAPGEPVLEITLPGVQAIPTVSDLRCVSKFDVAELGAAVLHPRQTQEPIRDLSSVNPRPLLGGDVVVHAARRAQSRHAGPDRAAHRTPGARSGDGPEGHSTRVGVPPVIRVQLLTAPAIRPPTNQRPSTI